MQLSIGQYCLIFCLWFPSVPAAQTSAAARWLAEDALKTYCDGSGRFNPGALIEADLTGDGRDDLVIYSEGIECSNGALTCGAVYCNADIYVRENDLLVSKGGFNTQCAELAPGTPPGITFCNRDSGRWTLYWNGREFVQ